VREHENRCQKRGEMQKKSESSIDGSTGCADMLQELNTSSHQDLVLEIVRDIKKDDFIL